MSAAIQAASFTSTTEDDTVNNIGLTVTTSKNLIAVEAANAGATTTGAGKTLVASFTGDDDYFIEDTVPDGDTTTVTKHVVSLTIKDIPTITSGDPFSTIGKVIDRDRVSTPALGATPASFRGTGDLTGKLITITTTSGPTPSSVLTEGVNVTDTTTNQAEVVACADLLQCSEIGKHLLRILGSTTLDFDNAVEVSPQDARYGTISIEELTTGSVTVQSSDSIPDTTTVIISSEAPDISEVAMFEPSGVDTIQVLGIDGGETVSVSNIKISDNGNPIFITSFDMSQVPVGIHATPFLLQDGIYHSTTDSSTGNIGTSILVTASYTADSDYEPGPDVPLTGLIAEILFEDNLVDTSPGSGNDGTVVGTETYVVGNTNLGKAGDFAPGAGNMNHLTLANQENFDFDFDDAFSFSFWIKTSTNSMKIFSKANSSTDRGYYIEIDASGRPLLNIINSLGSSHVQIFGNKDLRDNIWHHVVITKSTSPAASGMTIYVDGSIVVPSSALSTLDAEILNDLSLSIGAESDGDTSFTGQLDNVRIYNRELASTEVSDLFKHDFSDSGDTISATDTYQTSLNTLVASGSGGTFPLVFDAGTGFITVVCQGDDDSDGACNGWENKGLPYDNADDVKLRIHDNFDLAPLSPGSLNPSASQGKALEDIWVEMDFMESTASESSDMHEPRTIALQEVIDVFAARGLRVHIDVDDGLVDHVQALNVWTDEDNKFDNDFNSIKNRWFGNYPDERSLLIPSGTAIDGVPQQGTTVALVSGSDYTLTIDSLAVSSADRTARADHVAAEDKTKGKITVREAIDFGAIRPLLVVDDSNLVAGVAWTDNADDLIIDSVTSDADFDTTDISGHTQIITTKINFHTESVVGDHPADPRDAVGLALESVTIPTN